MPDDIRRRTVSELIRETKPDWEPVRTRERRTTTGSFSGALQVNTGVTGIHDKAGRLIGGTIDMAYAERFDAQVERFDAQNRSGVTDTFWEERDVIVDDYGQERVVVSKVTRRERT